MSNYTKKRNPMCTPCKLPGLCSTYHLLQDDKFSKEEMNARLAMIFKILKDPSLFKEYYESANKIQCPFCALLFWHVSEVDLALEVDAELDITLNTCPVCDDDYDRKDGSDDRCDNDDHEDCCDE